MNTILPAFVAIDNYMPIGEKKDLIMEISVKINDDPITSFLARDVSLVEPPTKSVFRFISADMDDRSKPFPTQVKEQSTQANYYDHTESKNKRRPQSPLASCAIECPPDWLSKNVASVFDQPSDTFLALLSSNKKQKMSYPVSMIDQIPAEHELSSNIVTSIEQLASDSLSGIQCSMNNQSSPVQANDISAESYAYPLNLAIQQCADAHILENLAMSAPAVIAMPDGPRGESALHILLYNKPHDQQTCDMMLLRNLSVATCQDQYFNTPLHTACAVGASLDIVKHIYLINPVALTQRNVHGLTPLQLCQQQPECCNQEVVRYLWQVLKEICLV